LRGEMESSAMFDEADFVRKTKRHTGKCATLVCGFVFDGGGMTVCHGLRKASSLAIIGLADARLLTVS